MASSWMNFSWVVDGQLAGAEGPARLDSLFYLHSEGVRAVIRMEEQTIAADIPEAAELRLADCYEPVPDFTPPLPPQIARMLKFIRQQTEEAGRPVVVTCYAGLGRTGVVLACYLVQQGYAPAAAIEHLRQLRPGSVITPEQEAAVYAYAESIGN